MRTALRDAVFHLCSCWDALLTLEGHCQAGTEVTVSDIQGVAGMMEVPGQIYYKAPDSLLDEYLVRILEEVNEEEGDV